MLPVGKHPETHSFHPPFHVLEFNSKGILFGFVYLDVNNLPHASLCPQIETLSGLGTFNNGVFTLCPMDICFFF